MNEILKLNKKLGGLQRNIKMIKKFQNVLHIISYWIRVFRVQE